MNLRKIDAERDIKTIRSAITNSTNASLQLRLNTYLNLSRPYYTPIYRPQDANRKGGRTSDLIGGFPFTSDDFPWPMHPNLDDFLQPIFQINLSKAGRLLRRDFGGGLVQLWGCSEESGAVLRFGGFELRHIPDEFARKRPSSFIPTSVSCAIDFDESKKSNPEIFWRSGGLMFLRNFEYIRINQSNITPFTEESILCLGEDVDKKLISELSEDYQILDHIQNLPYSGTYLGGHGGGPRSHGPDPQNALLIFRLFNDDDDCAYDLSANANKGGNYIFDFEVNFMG